MTGGQLGGGKEVEGFGEGERAAALMFDLPALDLLVGIKYDGLAAAIKSEELLVGLVSGKRFIDGEDLIKHPFDLLDIARLEGLLLGSLRVWKVEGGLVDKGSNHGIGQ